MDDFGTRDHFRHRPITDPPITDAAMIGWAAFTLILLLIFIGQTDWS